MRIVYTEHAKERMRQREVSLFRVFETVRRPEKISFLRVGRKKAVRRYGTRSLVVIYVVESVLYIIITTYHESNV